MQKQLLFDFMPRVVLLEYIGGQDEGLGGYCEALEIKYSRGPSDFLLHEMCQFAVDGRILSKHRKIQYKTKKQLLADWDGIYMIWNFSERWENTDSFCGYDPDVFRGRYDNIPSQ